MTRSSPAPTSAGKDLVNLTTGTPGEARARAAWAAERGARLLDGGIMAVPPMIGVPDSGAYVFYSGPKEVFEAHRETLAVPAGAVYVGEDAGMAALHDVALLSAMLGMMSGMAHAYALFRREKIAPGAPRRACSPTGSRAWPPRTPASSPSTWSAATTPGT